MKNLQNYPPVLTPRQLAEILDVGYTKALNVVKYSDLPSVKIGNTYRIYRDNLQEWLETKQKRAVEF